MADVFTKKKRSEVMSRIRSRGNADTELALVRLLRAHKISGWRRHVRVAVDGSKLMVDGRKRRGPHHQPSTKNHQLTVRPDFVFRKSRTVIFVDGCFWHGCPKHGTKPKGNASFWRKKFAANQARDRRVNRALRRAGWRVIRIWEHELRQSGKRKAEKQKLRHLTLALTPAGFCTVLQKMVGARRLCQIRNSPQLREAWKQVVVPRYKVGSLIFGAPTNNALNIYGRSYLWVDLNVSGRAWCRKFDQS